MRHHLFEEANSYNTALLFKSTAFNKSEIQSNYVSALNAAGIPSTDLIAFTLKYNDTGKAPMKFVKEYLSSLLPAVTSLGVNTLYVADATYFKALTGQVKAEPHYGYVLPCKIKGFEGLNVVLGLNYQSLIYNPDLQEKLDMSLSTLVAHKTGTYQAPGTGIIHSAQYPESLQNITQALASLHKYDSLTCDIEAFSLRFNEAGVATVAFAWDQHNGLAFACDYKEVVREDGSMDSESPKESWAAHAGYSKPNLVVRQMLREFFTTYKGELIFHNATYDVKVLIYTLWMKDLLDTEGLLLGLKTMCRAFQDTKIIAYLATNSTAGNILNLKHLAHSFAGNWAVEDIKDVRKIPLKDLLQYNLVDALSTWFVKNKYTPVMIQDQQEELYKTLMLPSLQLIIQIELTGMPLDSIKVQLVKDKLEIIQQTNLDVIQNSPLIKVLNLLVQTSAWDKDFDDRKAKAKNPQKIQAKDLSAFDDKVFNPNSGPQLQRLLYEQMGLPVLDYTDTKQPATGADTIEKLIHHTTEPAYKELLSALIGYGKVSKILTTFIPAFEAAILKGDGLTWLHGNFNLGGTVSGRLSSSSPNLQNIPAGSIYAKLIKECFISPHGWLFSGADFSSLEDMISALTTKDKNKLKVYTDGYCGHCLRAYSYFVNELPEVRQANDHERCFSIEVNGQLLLCKSGDFVKLESGETIHVEDYFDTYC